MEVLFANIAGLDFHFDSNRIVWNDQRIGRKPDQVDLSICWFCLQLKEYVLTFPSKVSDIGLLPPSDEGEQAKWDPIRDSRHFVYLLCTLAEELCETGSLLRKEAVRPSVAEVLKEELEPREATLRMAAVGLGGTIDHFRLWCAKAFPFPGTVQYTSMVYETKSPIT